MFKTIVAIDQAVPDGIQRHQRSLLDALLQHIASTPTLLDHVPPSPTAESSTSLPFSLPNESCTVCTTNTNLLQHRLSLHSLSSSSLPQPLVSFWKLLSDENDEYISKRTLKVVCVVLLVLLVSQLFTTWKLSGNVTHLQKEMVLLKQNLADFAVQSTELLQQIQRPNEERNEL